MVQAWAEGNREREIIAYQGLALQNFYLGHIKRSAQYSERALMGIYEADHSSQKTMAMQVYARNKQKARERKFGIIGEEYNMETELKDEPDFKIIRNGENITFDITADNNGL